MEYEYSFEVIDIEPFVKFCESENYNKESCFIQTRVLYKNKDKILARITTNEQKGILTSYLDLKEENESDAKLKISKESSELELNEANREFVDTMLEILNFKKSKTLKRKRPVYTKDKVTFEIDDYITPAMKVVAIEGKKEEVDKVYMIIKKKYADFIKE